MSYLQRLIIKIKKIFRILLGVYYQAFEYEKNWAYGWVKAPSAAPYEKGRWMISIFDDMAQELLYSAWFEVE